MNSGDVVATLVIEISTVVGVLATIWWPRKVEAGSARARAFRTLRAAAACLLAGYVLIIIGLGMPPVGDTPLEKSLATAMLGTVPLTPLSSAALAIERGRRLRALFSCYGALLAGAALVWVCVLGMLIAREQGAPFWRLATTAAATLCCGASVTFIMELYAAVRRPAPPRA